MSLCALCHSCVRQQEGGNTWGEKSKDPKISRISSKILSFFVVSIRQFLESTTLNNNHYFLPCLQFLSGFLFFFNLLISATTKTGFIMSTHPVTCSVNSTVCSGTSCLVPESNFNAILSTVLSIVLTVMLAMVMFSMGCTVEVHKLWAHIRRPWGIFIGFLCQFGIMPFAAFALSLAFQVLPIQAVVILIMGCCPGGSSSNVITYWLDGDMDLRWEHQAFAVIVYRTNYY